MKVEVRFHVGESDGILEFEILYVCNSVVVLYEDVAVQIFNDVVEFLVHYLLHVDFDFGLEVVHSVDEAADISLEGPAGV